MLDLTWLLVAVPLASAFVLLLAGKRANPWGHWLGVAASGTAFFVGPFVINALSSYSKSCIWRKTQTF